MELSIALKNNVKELIYHPTEVEFQKIPEITVKNYYSPFVFKDNTRNSKNFVSANVIILDIDEGLSIEQAKAMLDGYRSLIVTTRSHQKTEKNGKTIKARDHFRIAICLKEPITDAANYKKIIKELIHVFGADKACSDLARFYYCNPNQEVFTIEGDKYWDISKYLKKEAENTQVSITPQEAKSKRKRIKLDGGKLVKTSVGDECSIDELSQILEDEESETIHCCIHPENHAHNDATPSCVVSRNGQFLNFKCFVCEDTAYYRMKEEEIPFHILEHKIVVQEGLTDIEEILKEAIYSLPYQYVKNSKEMTSTVIRNILENSALEICSFARTLHVYYFGKWFEISDTEVEKYLFVKGAIEQTLACKNPPSYLIEQVYTELKTMYFPLNSYLNKDSVYINMNNTILCISKEGSIETSPHDPAYGFKWILPYNYNPEAKCPQILQFLDDVITDADTIKVIQEYCGYTFMPHKFLNHEKSLWLYGSTGANGKSVFLSLVHHLIDETNISHLNLSDLEDPIKRTVLSGKVVNITNDATVKNIDTGTYKALISGETTTIRQLYKGSSELKAIPKFIIATNELPLMKQGAEAFIRRMILVPFDKQIPESQRDIHLSSKLSSEVEGFFNFALEGLQRLIQNRHFTKSSLIESSTSDYVCELDVLNDFLQDHPIEALHGKNVQYVEQGEIFTKVGEWCKINHRKNPYTTPRQLRDRLISQKGHSFEVYKNNTIYGIKGRWQLKKMSSNIPSDVSDYE